MLQVSQEILSDGERQQMTWGFIKTYFIKFSCNLIIVKTDYEYFDFIS